VDDSRGSVSEPLTICATRGESAEAVLRRLGLRKAGRPTIVVCGGAGKLDRRRRRRFRASELLGPDVIGAARDRNAVVVDGGTRSGVMRFLGEARVRDPCKADVLIGVAPRGQVERGAALDPHHTHRVKAEGDKWGDETDLLFRIAAAASRNAPAVVVLLSGGRNAREEVLEAVRRGWPIAVIRGFGGFSRRLVIADRVMRAVRWCRLKRPVDWLNSRIAPELHMILGRGKLAFIGGGPGTLKRWIEWELTDRPTLKGVWRTFAAYETQAGLLQAIFRRMQMAIIVLGIAATALATFHDKAAEVDADASRLLTAAAPALIALLIALAARRTFGERWIVLRGAAESIKSETFRYRTRTHPYDTAPSPDRLLIERVDEIRSQLMDTPAAAGRLSLDPSPGPPHGLDDASLSDLDSRKYVDCRIVDQIGYYERTVRRKIRRRNLLQALALLAGAVGTTVAAVGGAPWVAITTAVSAGAVSYLATRQHEQDVLTYNQAAADLESINGRWNAMDDEARRAAKPQVVERTEAILTDEVGAWGRRMARVLEQEAKRQKERARR
jgi:hypothetical protein